MRGSPTEHIIDHACLRTMFNELTPRQACALGVAASTQPEVLVRMAMVKLYVGQEATVNDHAWDAAK